MGSLRGPVVRVGVAGVLGSPVGLVYSRVPNTPSVRGPRVLFVDLNTYYEFLRTKILKC